MNKQYTSYGITRRSPFLWLAVSSMLLSVAARIVYYSLSVKEAEGVGSTGFPFFFLILPIIAGLWYIYALIVHGEKRLYKTIAPCLVGVVFLISRILILNNDSSDETIMYWWHPVLAIALCIAAYIVYSLTLNAGRIKSRIPVIILFAIPFIGHIVFENIPSLVDRRHQEFAYWLGEISLSLIRISMMFMLIGMKKIISGRPLPRRGDRNDGRRLRSIDPITGVGVYIMRDRNGARNSFRDSFECTNAENYIHKKRAEGLAGFGFMHLILAAYVRSVSQRPGINRFISGQKIYSRDDEIEVCMVIKKEMSLEGSETIVNVFFSPKDTAEDIYKKFNAAVQEVKASSELDSGFDKAAGLLNFIPGVLMKFTVWFLKLLDYFGFLPRSLLKLSPFHGSFFMTSMGSLGIPPIYHHLYDFGNIPIFLAFGIKRRQNEILNDGSVVHRKYIDFTISSDDRICDGFYYASAIKYFKHCLNDPERLDTPPEKVEHDVD